MAGFRSSKFAKYSVGQPQWHTSNLLGGNNWKRVRLETKFAPSSSEWQERSIYRKKYSTAKFKMPSDKYNYILEKKYFTSGPQNIVHKSVGVSSISYGEKWTKKNMNEKLFSFPLFFPTFHFVSFSYELCLARSIFLLGVFFIVLTQNIFFFKFFFLFL